MKSPEFRAFHYFHHIEYGHDIPLINLELQDMLHNKPISCHLTDDRPP